MASHPKPSPFKPSEVWMNSCQLCGTNNPSGPKETPPKCAGCGHKLEPFRDDGEGWGVWQHEERRVVDAMNKRARAKERQRQKDERRQRRLARRLAQ